MTGHRAVSRAARLLPRMASLALVAAMCAAPADVRPPQRIVSLVPNVTEMLFAIGAGREVVGVSKDRKSVV